MELKLPDDFGTPYEESGLDFPEWIDEMSEAHEALLSSWGWNPTLPFPYCDDTMLTLERAVCLPEFGGQLFICAKASIRGPSISVKTLRAAMDKGDLVYFQPNKNQYVTPRTIREWMETCRVTSKNPISSSEAPVTTSTRAVSRTTQRGSSKTATASPSQDAVSMILKALSEPSTNTTSRNTPKRR